jgi:steroid 5-alpha reductase family enzyme
MGTIVSLFAINGTIIFGLLIVLWLISIAIKDVSFIDSFWGFSFVIIAAVTYCLTESGASERRLLILCLTAIWGTRLAAYLFWRWRKEGPDGRYIAMLSRAQPHPHRFSLKMVFLLQGVLLLIVSLPIQLGSISAEPFSVGVMGWIGAGLAVIGILFETIGDWQLARFKARETGGVMDKGLWRYTRHPNYFGDICVWWGLFLIAAETTLGLFGIIGPIVMTYLLVKWSGAALLERRLKRSKPEYEDYIRRTSSFLPMPPKKS